MPVVQADDGERVAPGVVYVARPDLHLTVTAGRHFAYRDGRRIKFLRSSAVPLLDSAAAAFGDRVVAVVLTGSGTDATDGVQRVKQGGASSLPRTRRPRSTGRCLRPRLRAEPSIWCCP